MLIRRKFGNAGKTEKLSYLPAYILGFFSVSFRRNHYVVGRVENLLVAVSYAQPFAACHRVSSYVLAVIPQHVLHIPYNTSLDTCYIGNDGSAFQILLIIPYPFFENVRIKGKNNNIRTACHGRVYFRGSFSNYVVFQCVFYSIFIRVYCMDFKAFFGQSSGITAADHSQTYNQYICIFINLQFSLPLFQGLSAFQKSQENSLIRPPHPLLFLL